MMPEQVCIFGGSGFIGTALARQLSELGVRAVVPTRIYDRARHLLVLPTVDVKIADVRDAAELKGAMAGCDAAVNLVGVLHPGKDGGFEGPHVEFARSVVKACAAAGVKHLVHMSALRADPNGASEYLRSKGRGEAAVREAAAAAHLRATILRPSIVFGRDDKFINMLARLVRWFPVIPLGSPHAKFQPIHVEDVARAIVACLGNPATAGETFNLCGTKVYTLRELIEFIAHATHRKRIVMELGPALSMLQAAVFEHLPGKLVTRDNVRTMSVENVCADPFPAVLGFRPSPLEAIVPQYLAGGAVPRKRYQFFRDAAGRGRVGNARHGKPE